LSVLGWFHALVHLMADVIHFFYQVTGSYGLAIILLTVAIRLLILPIYQKQMTSMRKMQELAPKMREIQERYKGDQARISQATMELYKEYGVNPFSGCWPTLVQLPFLWAIYETLQTYHYVGSSHFLWLANLRHTDPYYILPLLAAATTYWQTRLTTPSMGDRTQQLMTTVLMPLFIGYISIRFPAGLVLYWVVSNLFAIAQQYVFFPRPAVATPRGATKS
jgi:YidC/Oxa1 family membrane protein insertase